MCHVRKDIAFFLDETRVMITPLILLVLNFDKAAKHVKSWIEQLSTRNGYAALTLLQGDCDRLTSNWAEVPG